MTLQQLEELLQAATGPAADLRNYETIRQGILALKTGVTSSVDITYADFRNLILSESLEVGTTYRITDYRSCNFLNGWRAANDFHYGNITPNDPAFLPYDVHYGAVEPILVTADSPNTIKTEARSETYPSDILQFDPIPNDMGVLSEAYNGDGFGTTGFDIQWDAVNQEAYFDLPNNVLLGHAFYIYAEFNGGASNINAGYVLRKNGVNAPQVPYTGSLVHGLDVTEGTVRVVLDGMNEATALSYDSDTLYVNYAISVGNSITGWCQSRKDVVMNFKLPWDWRSHTFRRFEFDLSSFVGGWGTGYYFHTDEIPANTFATGVAIPTTGNYIDYPSVDPEFDLWNVDWDGISEPVQYNFYIDNNVFLNKFDISKVFGYQIYGNTFTGNVEMLDFKGYALRNNIIGSFTNNRINCNSMFGCLIDNCRDNSILVQNPNKINGSIDRSTIHAFSFNNNKGDWYGCSLQGTVSGNDFATYQIANTQVHQSLQNCTFGGNVTTCEVTYIIGATFNTAIQNVTFKGQVNPVAAVTATILNDTASHKMVYRATDDSLRIYYHNGTAWQDVLLT